MLGEWKVKLNKGYLTKLIRQHEMERRKRDNRKGKVRKPKEHSCRYMQISSM